MRKLNAREIKEFADYLGFTESEAKDITDLFYNLKANNRIRLPLDIVDEYILEWENHWHRENNFRDCFLYEKENEYYEYGEIAELIFANEEAFREYSLNEFVFQLPNNDMVVVVR